MAKTLPLKDCAWTLVFRRIVAQLRADPDFRRVVADRLKCWEGLSTDRDPLTPSAGQPVVRLTPNPGGVAWYDPSSQAGTLGVRVEIAVQGLSVDDVANLWHTIVAALRPGNLAFSQALVALDAITGEIVFNQPAFDPRPASEPAGYFLAEGRFSLAIRESIIAP